MHIVVVAGARPNFMKISPIARQLDEADISFSLVHTGQHYDALMSDVFFDELQIRRPDHVLDVGSGSHAVQTASIMTGFEPVIGQENPDLVMVVGDVNSTIACALTATKMGVPVAHVEAGLRSGDRSMPEEINRLVTDVISDLLLAPSQDAVENLLGEGVPTNKIHLVGNVMADSLLGNLERALERPVIKQLDLDRGGYALVTLHRPALVDHPDRLNPVLDALEEISRSLPVVWPVHPRTRSRLTALGRGVRLLEPQGYLDFVALEAGAKLVITDSGGVQEETTMLGIPCLTMRENTERPITVTDGTNRVIGTRARQLLEAVAAVLESPSLPHRPDLWDGRASERIVEVLRKWNPAITSDLRR
jgi:UDP-N-acetylglucosamine 2-epimerase (non-hydrolysing)